MTSILPLVTTTFTTDGHIHTTFEVSKKEKDHMPTHVLESPKDQRKLTRIDAETAISDVANTWKKAAAADIKLAKRHFISRLLELGLSVVSLGLAITITVATGGLGAPLIAFASLGVVISVADAGCAFAVWHAKKQAQEGKDSLTIGLRMGDDAIANVVFSVCQRLGVTEEQSVTASLIASYFTRVGISVATLFYGAFVIPPTTMGTGALSLACTLADPISRAISFIVRGLISSGYVDVHKIKSLLSVQELLSALEKNNNVKEEQIAELTQENDGLQREIARIIAQQRTEAGLTSFGTVPVHHIRQCTAC